MARLVVPCALLLVASHANAITITQTGLNSEGDTLFKYFEPVVLQYWLDNMGSPGLTVIAFSVIFDDHLVSYDAPNSKIQRRILAASDDEGGNTPANYNYAGMQRLSSAPTVQGGGNEILFAWSSGPNPAWAEVSNQLVGTAVFHWQNAGGPVYVGPGIGTGALFEQDTGSYTNSGQTFANLTEGVMFQGGGYFYFTPEPTTALLLGVGIAGLSLGRARRQLP